MWLRLFSSCRGSLFDWSWHLEYLSAGGDRLAVRAHVSSRHVTRKLTRLDSFYVDQVVRLVWADDDVLAVRVRYWIVLIFERRISDVVLVRGTIGAGGEQTERYGYECEGDFFHTKMD